MKSFRLLLLVMVIAMPAVLPGDPLPYQWSSITRNEKRKLYGYAVRFLDAFNKKEFQKLKFMLPTGEISNRGRHWMSIPRFMYLVSAARANGPMRHGPIELFTFDDCAVKKKARLSALRHFHIFNHNSAIAVTTVREKNGKEVIERPFSMVFQKTGKKNAWKLISVYGLTPELDKKAIPDLSKKEKGWRIDEILQLDLTLLIPPDFSHKKFEGSIVTWSLNKKKQQEAVIQVMAAKTGRSSLEEGRLWLRRFLKNRRYTTVRAMLLPQGYRFELEMIDRDGKKNKVIMAALRKKRYTVFVIFIGYLSLYEKRYRQIDFTMQNLLLD